MDDRPFMAEAIRRMRDEGWEGSDDRLAGTFRCRHLEAYLALVDLRMAVRDALPSWLMWMFRG